jgi:hypothetical protein
MKKQPWQNYPLFTALLVSHHRSKSSMTYSISQELDLELTEETNQTDSDNDELTLCIAAKTMRKVMT